MPPCRVVHHVRSPLNIRSSRAATLASLALLVFAAGCSDTPTAAERRLTTVEVQPRKITVDDVEPIRLNAVLRDHLGQTTTARRRGVRVRWYSTDPEIATVDADGVVTPVSSGTADIVAEIFDARGTSPQSAYGADLEGITPLSTSASAVGVNGVASAIQHVSGSGQTGLPGSTLPNDIVVRAVAKNGAGLAGIVVDFVPGSGAGSFNPASTTTAADGTARSTWTLGAANGTQSATVRGRKGSATLSISATANAACLSVTPTTATLTAIGATVALTPTSSVSGTVAWSTSNPAVATVSSGGIVTAVGNGSATITGTLNPCLPATTTVTVAQAVATVTTTPATPSIQVGQTAQLTATAKDANGNAIAGVSFTWASNNTGVATVNTSGLVSGVATGSATVTASVSGKSGSSTVTVTAQAIASVTTTPATASVQVGQTTQVTATARDSNGATLNGVTFAWTSSNAAVASVNASGLVTGVAAGSANIIATAGGKADTTAVTVTAATGGTVANVTVNPATASVTAGQTVQLTAAATDANGAPVNGVSFTWASNSPAIATVNSSGLVTAVASGSATITASAGGKTGSATITVPAPGGTISKITVTPSTASVPVNQTVQLTAAAADTNGVPLNGVSFTWETNNSAVAVANANGLVIGVAAGTATITARAGGRFGTATVTVTTAAPPSGGGTVATVTVTPSSRAVEVNQTVQLDAVARDAGGAVITDVAFTWTSSNTAAATVNTYGMVTGKALGSTTITASAGGKTGTSAITVTAATGLGGGDPANFNTIKQGIRPRGFNNGAPYSLKAPVAGRIAYYVATNGNDSNPGTMSAPFRTINQAAQVAIAGDVVIIRNGTYQESIIVPGNGSASAPIVFQAQNRGGVTLTGGQYVVQPWFYIGSVGNTPHRYYTFKGLIFNQYGSQGTNGVAIRAFAGWAIEDCLFDNSAETAIAVIDSNIRIERTTFVNHWVHAFNVYGGYGGGTSPTDPNFRPIENLLIKDVVLRNNHTRNLSGAAELSSRVVKISVSRGTVVDNVESYENYGSGMWLDNKNTNYVVRNSYFHDNRGVNNSSGVTALDAGRGLYIEKNWGTGLVENNLMEDNAGAGIVIVSSNDINLNNNLLRRNEQAIQLLAVTGPGYEDFLLRNVIFRRTYMKGWRSIAAVWARGGDFSLGPAGMNINVDQSVYDTTNNGIQLAAWPAPIYGASTIAQLQSKFGWEFSGSIGSIPD